MYRACKTPGGNDLNETRSERKQRDAKRSKRKRGRAEGEGKKQKKTRTVGGIPEGWRVRGSGEGRGRGARAGPNKILIKFS